MKETNYMAWYKYPEPQGKEYSEQDVENQSIVQEIFDYCQINLAIISKYGWKKIIQFHGVSAILDINRKSGWFDGDDDREALEDIKYNCLISGYDPERNLFGVYDEESGVFVDDNSGKTSEIKWGIDWQPSTE